MNGYARLSHVKADVAGMAGVSDIDDTLLRLIDEESRAIERRIRRYFYSVLDTKYLGADRQLDNRASNSFFPLKPAEPHRLWLNDDLISISAIAADLDLDGSFETSLSASDYFLWPYSAAVRGQPYRALDLNPVSTVLSSWSLYTRGMSITGIWGYSNETEAAGQLNGALNDSTTAVTVDAGHDIEEGETIVIGSEQMYVANSDSTTLTVTRAINGTTAAAHADDSTVYRRRYPREIERACKLAVVRGRWQSQSGYAGQVLTGDTDPSGRMPEWYLEWNRLVSAFRIPLVG